MIPNSDQLLAISHMRSGDLAEIPFAVVLHAMAVHKRSVQLEIERKPLRKEIVIENGVPVDCRSNLLHETLARFMISQGQLTEEKSQEYLGKAAAQGLQFGEALIVDGYISASELYRLLQANLARKLLDGFTWRSGSFNVNSDPPPVESPLKVKVAQLVVTGIGKFASDEEVNGAVGPLVGRELHLHPQPPYPREEIRLGKAQQHLMGLLSGGRRIDQLAAETTIPFDQIMRLLYSLAVIGVVVPAEELPEGFTAEEAGAAGAGAAVQDADGVAVSAAIQEPADQPIEELAGGDGGRVAPREDTVMVKLQPQTDTDLAAEDAERLKNRVMEAYLRYRKLDAFDLLEVAEKANLMEIQDAFIAHSKRFAPWQYRGDKLESLREKAQDLFIAGGQAFGELCDAEKRNALVMRRRRQREEQAKKPATDRFAIKSDLLDSELQFKKGKSLMMQGKFREALTQLSFAYDCDPQNAVYRAELAYCRFRDAPQSEGPRAVAELRESLRIDPQSGLAVYYLGMVQMALEQYDEAETQLQRAIKMLMPDRRPIEGLKELQTRAKGKKRKLGFLKA
ncbi:MAG: DUF4388 domain-containing protein [Acidobacteriota bacterium]